MGFTVHITLIVWILWKKIEGNCKKVVIFVIWICYLIQEGSSKRINFEGKVPAIFLLCSSTFSYWPNYWLADFTRNCTSNLLWFTWHYLHEVPFVGNHPLTTLLFSDTFDLLRSFIPHIVFFDCHISRKRSSFRVSFAFKQRNVKSALMQIGKIPYMF